MASLLPLAASVNIMGQIGQLRNTSGTVIDNTPTLFVLVYDDNDDGLFPGGLRTNKSLDSSNGPSIHATFAGKSQSSLKPGALIGADKILMTGTINGTEGFAVFDLLTADLDGTGVVLESGRHYALYWFPGVSTPSIPTSNFQVGGIQETIDFTGDGAGYIGMQIPPDGHTVTTLVYDADLGGDISDPARFTAINANPEPTLYAQWRTLHFPDPGDFANDAISGPLACPSGDGVSNLVRYAHGVGPHTQVTGLMPVLAATPEAPFTFRFRYDPTKTDLAWRVTAGNQLTDWTQVLFDSRTSQIPPLDDGWLPVPLPPNLGGGPAMDPRMFARLEVIELAP
ncbi:MAG: hypothetical protein K9M97_02380 [Akkermansiaceae bacterium]|nr:hypothetical protein [Akkermansiaceae bacterium]